jgi:hypothetical protein
MAINAPQLHDELIRISEAENGYDADAGVTESDIRSWLLDVDVDALKHEFDEQINRTPVKDLRENVGISDSNLCVCDVISSHNDNPENYDSAYIIRANRTIVQYKNGASEEISQ